MLFTDGLAKSAVVVVPHDTNEIVAHGLYVGVKGDVKVRMANGQDVTFKDLGAGAIHPISVIRVYATGTTATTIIGVY